VPIPMAVRSTARVCGSSLAGIAGSNPVDVYLLRVLCVVWKRSLFRTERSSRGVLPRIVSECDLETSKL